MQITPIKTKILAKGDDLILFIDKYIPTFHNGDILVVTSKIVSLSENNVVPKKEKIAILKTLSTKFIETPWALLTYINDEWKINGGADESNTKQGVTLLPNDPFKTAYEIMVALKKKHALTSFGVIITDTRSVPLRKGTVGRAIGFAGIQPLKSYIGKKDIFGRKSKVTVSNHADALASAAVLTMGEGNECVPLAIISDAPITFTNKPITKANTQLSIAPEKDIFSYVYRNADKKKTPKQ